MRKIAFALILSAIAAPAARPRFAPSDLWAWRTASDPRISPDGKWVVYVEERNDRGSDSAAANLWVVSIDGKIRRALTEGVWRDYSPRWSPDSTRIAWISGRGGSPHLRIATLDLRPEEQLSGLDQSPLGLAWSPDGRMIAFTAAGPAGGRVQLYIAAAGPEGRIGPPRPMPAGELDLRGEPVWMPDGRSLLSSAADGQIYAIPADGGAAKRITNGAARNENPVPSPDGAKIAWLSTANKPQSYVTRLLCETNADGGSVKVLAGALDRDPAYPHWSSDSRTIYFIADDHGASHVYAAHNDGSVRQVTGAAERLRGFSLADSGRAVTVRSTATDPAELVTLTVDVASEPARLAAWDETLVGGRETGAVEEIHYDSEGRSIQAWLVKPPDFDSSKKYPLLLDIAGAPRVMYGTEFPLRAHVYAARGYVVLCANPRGTPGYGEEFGNLLETSAAQDAAADLLRGVDFAESKGYVDPQRLLMTGGSLAAWIIGHDDRFRAAVVKHPGAGAAQPRNRKTATLVIATGADPAQQPPELESFMVRMAADKPSAQVAELETELGWLGRF